MNEPKVLHVTDAFGAGVSVAIGQYVANGPGSQVVVGMRRNGEQAGVEHWMPAKRVHLVTNWAELMGLYRDLAAEADVVHLHSTVAGVLCRLKLRGRPVVYSPHALAYLGGRWFSARRLAFLVERALTGRTSAAGAVSLAEANELYRIGYPSDRVIYVPHAIRALVESPRSLSEGSELSIVGVGRVAYQKDPGLFAAIALRFRKFTHARFTWVGGGDPKLVAKLRNAGVEVTGWQSRAAALKILNEHDVLLHTARYEGMPLVCLEGMAAGLPVVARALPAYRQLHAVSQFTDIEGAIDVLERLRKPEVYYASSADSWKEASYMSPAAQRNALGRLYEVAMS